MVCNLTNDGAFVELEEGVDGLLHVSDMSWTRKISHANEMLKKGDEITCQVISVDQERKRIALGLKQLTEDPWETHIPTKYQPGELVKGKVTKITNFGVFVELEPELEGLLHVSELSDQKVENPEGLVKVGQDLEVRILRISIRRNGRSYLAASRPPKSRRWKPRNAKGLPLRRPARPELKGGTEGSSGPLFSMGANEEADAAEEAAPPAEYDSRRPTASAVHGSRLMSIRDPV